MLSLKCSIPLFQYFANLPSSPSHQSSPTECEDLPVLCIVSSNASIHEPWLWVPAEQCPSVHVDHICLPRAGQIRHSRPLRTIFASGYANIVSLGRCKGVGLPRIPCKQLFELPFQFHLGFPDFGPLVGCCLLVRPTRYPNIKP